MNFRPSLTLSQKAQFNSMPKVFESSVTKEYKVLDKTAVVSSLTSLQSPHAERYQQPPSVQISLSQLYTLKMPKTDKLVKSLITFHVDPKTNLITQ